MKAAGTVGKNVHDLIISREMSVKEFAKSIGVSSMTVYLWIEGKRLPRWYAIERIERLYGVWILTNEECHAELSGKAIGKNIRNLVLKRGMSYMCFTLLDSARIFRITSSVMDCQLQFSRTVLESTEELSTNGFMVMVCHHLK